MQSELRISPDADFAQKVVDFMDSCLIGSETVVPARQANRLRIAADEVASNLLAYSGATEVLCQFAVHGSEIILKFSDDGVVYNPLSQSVSDTTSSVEDRPIGGLGLLLVKRLMSDIRYERSAGKNILTLQLHL